MNASNLQAMIAINADRIRAVSATYADHMNSAKQFNEAGEKAFAIEQYQFASHAKRKLVKATNLQGDMKIELAHLRRLVRVASKARKVFAAVGHQFKPEPGMTSFEQERAIDEMVRHFVPKKADSRLLTVAA
jgi:hypothetical protein